MYQQPPQQPGGNPNTTGPNNSMSPTRRPRQNVPPPINTQPQPRGARGSSGGTTASTGLTPIMRQGRFLSSPGSAMNTTPSAAAGMAGGQNRPVDGSGTPSSYRGYSPQQQHQQYSRGRGHPSYQHQQQYQQQQYPQQYPQQYQQQQQQYPQQYQQQQQQQPYTARGTPSNFNPISPAGTVRFEEEANQRSPINNQDQVGGTQPFPTFLFDDGDYDLSEQHEHDNDGNNDNADNINNEGDCTILPTEAQLTLLCLDYLRDLRRSYSTHHDDALNAEGLHPDYISLAIWSLSRAFVKPNAKLMHGDVKVSKVVEQVGKRRDDVETSYMMGGGGLSDGLEGDEMRGNDAWYRQLDEDLVEMSIGEHEHDTKKQGGVHVSGGVGIALTESIVLPTMEDITNEVLLRHPKEPEFEPNKVNADKDEDEEDCDDDNDNDEPHYEHNDKHTSNSHRFYLLNGLASDASSQQIDGLMTPRTPGTKSTPHNDNGGGAYLSPRCATSNNATISSGGPLSFGEIVSAGLTGLRARSRIEAEKEMVYHNPLFTQFVAAASAGGFFQEKKDDVKRIKGTPKPERQQNPQEEARRSKLLYQEKYRKVVNKFRSKLATNEASLLAGNKQSTTTTPQSQYHFGSPSRMSSAYRIMSGNASVSSAGGHAGGDSVTGGGGGRMWDNVDLIVNNNVADRQRRRRERRIERVKSLRGQGVLLPKQAAGVRFMEEEPATTTSGMPVTPEMQVDEETPLPVTQPQATTSPSRSQATAQSPASAQSVSSSDPNLLPHYQEAEGLNTVGNTQMQSKSFALALETYTSALQLAPAGPNSHVYYSNRSAAHLSLNQYQSSIQDSHKSLSLKPKYAKAHSRLGLAYFASGEYSKAVEAYEMALEIDPENEWSHTHLEKAKDKLKALNDVVESDEEKVENIYVVNEADGSETSPSRRGIDPEPSMEEEEGDGDDWPSPFDENTGKESGTEGEAAESEVSAVNEVVETEEEIAEKACQADSHKDRGNQSMSNKEYEKALEHYNAAIQISPAGPRSHVYYSNRAAAYCYLAEYDAATADCESSIALSPTYEKAHARLGLSLFFRGEYQHAIEAYTKSLELDPNNKASASYLKKARARFDEQEKERAMLEEQQRLEEEEERAREEKQREKEELKRKRAEWLARQQQQSSHQHSVKEDHTGQETTLQEEVELSLSHEDDGFVVHEEGNDHQYNYYAEGEENGFEEDEDHDFEDEEHSLGDNTGITSTGLTSIVTNDNEIEVARSPSVNRLLRTSLDQQQQRSPVIEAFDPFVTEEEDEV